MEKRQLVVLEEIIATKGDCLFATRCSDCPFASKCFSKFMTQKAPSRRERVNLAADLLAQKVLLDD